MKDSAARSHNATPRRSASRVSVGRIAILGIVVAVVGLSAAAAIASTSSGTATRANLPPDKQAILRQEQAIQSSARAEFSAKPTPPPGGQPGTIPPRQSGLIRGIKQGPFPPTEFQNNDFWQGDVNGTWIQVYAGADVTGPSPIGELRLYSMPVNPNDGPNVFKSLGTFRPPHAEASLFIASVQADVLILTAPSGDRYTFDLATRTFASA
jgi:type II secretory pathway pseudopilin PulG